MIYFSLSSVYEMTPITFSQTGRYKNRLFGFLKSTVRDNYDLIDTLSFTREIEKDEGEEEGEEKEE